MGHLKATTEIPSGKNILATLANLLADQEGVTITYEVKNGGTKDA